MNYKKIHDQIINRALFQNRKRNRDRSKQEIYYELHHILPKCLCGSNDKSNLVLLTAREHFLVHWLLCRIYPENHSLSSAFFRSCQINHINRNFIPSSRSYQEAREKYSIARSFLQKGSNHSKEHIENNAKSNSKGNIEVFKNDKFVGTYRSRNFASKVLQIPHINRLITKESINKDGYTVKFIPNKNKKITAKITRKIKI